MAPDRSGNKRRQDDDDEDGNSNIYSSETPSQGSEPPKRQRLSRNRDESDDDNDESQEIIHTNGVNGSNGANRAANIAGEDGFQPGAIRRVWVENFVTYENAEFRPGPNLNMVIGPNGTGKSSLVCAICLGLGYSPKHLGRAASVKEFVKHHKDVATIEIELQRRPQDSRNWVVRVQIRREQNNQKWWLNGKETTHKTIQTLMKDLKIQVDNLCQFLPQDKVVEFAACTPVELLHQTLRAAAPPQMLEWQKNLKELDKRQKDIQQNSGADTELLSNLESRQQGLQADVDRLREREEIQTTITDLKDARLAADYYHAREGYEMKKQELADAKARLKTLQDETAPSLADLKRKQEYQEQIAVVVQDRKAVLQRVEQVADGLLSAVEDADDQTKSVDDKLDAEIKGHDVKKRERMKIRATITRLEAELKNKPAEFNPQDHNTKIRAQEHQLRDLEGERRELEDKYRLSAERGSKVRSDKERLQQELNDLDSQEGLRLNWLKRNHPEVAKGFEWLKENQDQFEKPVFGPPMLSCSVKDERYSDQVQSLLGFQDFMCFTAQTMADWKKLNQCFFSDLRISVSTRSCSQPLSAYAPKISNEQARALGLDGFAIDYLDGPEPVLAMLCSEKKLHLSGVALSDITTAQYDRLVEVDLVNSWAAGSHFYRITRRREFGSSGVSTLARKLNKGQFWTDQPIDAAEKTDLQRRLRETEELFNNLKIEHRELKEQRDNLPNKGKDIRDNIDELKKIKSELQKAWTKWQAIPEKIGSEQRAEARKVEELQEAKNGMRELSKARDAAVLDKARATLRHHQGIAAIREARQALLDAQIRFVEAKSDVGGLAQRNADITTQLDQERVNIAAAQTELLSCRDRARAALSKVQEFPDERRALIKELADGKTPQDIDIEISAEEAKLELIHAANPNIIREFEKRARDIEKLREKLQSVLSEVDDLTRQIRRIREQWEPKLDELISKINDAFSYNFEKISCAGEVRVHKDEDFDLWALEILVKFRENETLQKLDQHRQSGGERAVSTIFYLMALQSMAQSPFRVVDEINQGMDPRNERMVHERMVEIACREHTSQYFLITPKLLTGLRYDVRMRVLCIASGEHMPKDNVKLDFGRCLAIQRRLLAAA